MNIPTPTHSMSPAPPSPAVRVNTDRVWAGMLSPEERAALPGLAEDEKTAKRRYALGWFLAERFQRDPADVQRNYDFYRDHFWGRPITDEEAYDRALWFRAQDDYLLEPRKKATPAPESGGWFDDWLAGMIRTEHPREIQETERRMRGQMGEAPDYWRRAAENETRDVSFRDHYLGMWHTIGGWFMDPVMPARDATGSGATFGRSAMESFDVQSPQMMAWYARKAGLYRTAGNLDKYAQSAQRMAAPGQAQAEELQHARESGNQFGSAAWWATIGGQGVGNLVMFAYESAAMAALGEVTAPVLLARLPVVGRLMKASWQEKAGALLLPSGALSVAEAGMEAEQTYTDITAARERAEAVLEAFERLPTDRQNAIWAAGGKDSLMYYRHMLDADANAAARLASSVWWRNMELNVITNTASLAFGGLAAKTLMREGARFPKTAAAAELLASMYTEQHQEHTQDALQNDAMAEALTGVAVDTNLMDSKRVYHGFFSGDPAQFDTAMATLLMSLWSPVVGAVAHVTTAESLAEMDAAIHTAERAMQTSDDPELVALSGSMAETDSTAQKWNILRAAGQAEMDHLYQRIDEASAVKEMARELADTADPALAQARATIEAETATEAATAAAEWREADPTPEQRVAALAQEPGPEAPAPDAAPQVEPATPAPQTVAPPSAPVKKRKNKRRYPDDDPLELARGDAPRVRVGDEEMRELRNAGVIGPESGPAGRAIEARITDEPTAQGWDAAAGMLARRYPSLGISADSDVVEVVTKLYGDTGQRQFFERLAAKEPGLIRADSLMVGERFTDGGGTVFLVLERHEDGGILAASPDGAVDVWGPSQTVTDVAHLLPGQSTPEETTRAREWASTKLPSRAKAGKPLTAASYRKLARTQLDILRAEQEDLLPEEAFSAAESATASQTVSTADRADLQARLHAEVAKFPALAGVRVALSDDLLQTRTGEAAWGLWRDGVIHVSMQSRNPLRVAREEIFHGLFERGVLTEAELAILKQKDQEWRDKHDIDALYPNVSDAKKAEEAYAHAWAELPETERTILDKVWSLFRALGNWLRGLGFRTAADVLSALDQGTAAVVDEQAELSPAAASRVDGVEYPHEAAPRTDQDSVPAAPVRGDAEAGNAVAVPEQPATGRRTAADVGTESASRVVPPNASPEALAEIGHLDRAAFWLHTIAAEVERLAWYYTDLPPHTAIGLRRAANIARSSHTVEQAVSRVDRERDQPDLQRGEGRGLAEAIPIIEGRRSSMTNRLDYNHSMQFREEMKRRATGELASTEPLWPRESASRAPAPPRDTERQEQNLVIVLAGMLHKGQKVREAGVRAMAKPWGLEAKAPEILNEAMKLHAHGVLDKRQISNDPDLHAALEHSAAHLRKLKRIEEEVYQTSVGWAERLAQAKSELAADRQKASAQAVAARSGLDRDELTAIGVTPAALVKGDAPADVATFAPAIRQACLDKLIAEGHFTARKTKPETDPVWRAEYARSMVALLGETARKILPSRIREQVLVSVRELRNRAWPPGVAYIERETGRILGMIHEGRVRETKAELLHKIDRVLSLKALRGPVATRKELTARDIHPAARRCVRAIKSVYDLGLATVEERLVKLAEVMNEPTHPARTNPTAAKAWRAKLESWIPEFKSDPWYRQRDTESLMLLANMAHGQYGALRHKTETQLAGALDDITYAIKGGMKAIERAEEALQARIAGDRNAVLAALQPAKPVKDIGDFWRTVKRELAAPLDFWHRLRLIGEYATDAAHADLKALSERLGQRNQHCLDRKTTLQREWSGKLDKALEGIYGMPAWRAKRELRMARPELAAFSRNELSPRNLSRQEALQVVAYCEQLIYRKPALAWGRNKNYVQALKRALPPQDLALLNWMREFYEQTRGEVSDVAETLTGLPVVSPDALYMPMQVWRPQQGPETVIHDSPILPGALASRVQHGYDVDETHGVLDMFDRRMGDTTHLIGFGEFGRDLRGIFGTEDVNAAIERLHGKGLLDAFRGQWTDILNGGFRSGYRMAAMDWLASFTALNYLSFRIASAGRQATGVLQFGHKIGLVNVAKYMADLPSSAAWDAIRTIRDSDQFKNRYWNGPNDLLANALATPTMNRFMAILKKGMVVPAFGDQLATLAVGQGIYRDAYATAIGMGMTEAPAREAALTRLFHIVNLTQQGTDPSVRPEWSRRGGQFGRYFGIFLQNQALMYAFEYVSLKEALAGRPGARRQALNTITVNHLLCPLALGGVNLAAKALFGDDRDDEWWKIVLPTIIGGPIGGMVVFGGLTETLIAGIIAGKPPYGSIVPGDWTVRGLLNATDMVNHLTYDFDWDQAVEDADRWGRKWSGVYKDASKLYENRIAE